MLWSSGQKKKIKKATEVSYCMNANGNENLLPYFQQMDFILTALSEKQTRFPLKALKQWLIQSICYPSSVFRCVIAVLNEKNAFI